MACVLDLLVCWSTFNNLLSREKCPGVKRLPNPVVEILPATNMTSLNSELGRALCGSVATWYFTMVLSSIAIDVGNLKSIGIQCGKITQK